MKIHTYSLSTGRYEFYFSYKIGVKLILSPINLGWFYSLPVCSLGMNNLNVIMVPELTQQKQRICTKDASFKVSKTDKFTFMHSNALFIHCSKLESNSLLCIKTMYLLDITILICQRTEVFDFGTVYVSMGLGILSEKVRLILISSLMAVTFTYWNYSLLLSYHGNQQIYPG